MTNEERLISVDEAKKLFDDIPPFIGMTGKCVQEMLDGVPTMDVVPVDGIRVDIMSLSLENQEAVLNVSICGKPNEVKIPFSKEVAEVVHAEWLDLRFDPMWKSMLATCSHCEVRGEVRGKANECGFAVPDSDYCPNCGAKMDGGKK